MDKIRTLQLRNSKGTRVDREYGTAFICKIILEAVSVYYYIIIARVEECTGWLAYCAVVNECVVIFSYQ